MRSSAAFLISHLFNSLATPGPIMAISNWLCDPRTQANRAVAHGPQLGCEIVTQQIPAGKSSLIGCLYIRGWMAGPT